MDGNSALNNLCKLPGAAAAAQSGLGKGHDQQHKVRLDVQNTQPGGAEWTAAAPNPSRASPFPTI